MSRSVFHLVPGERDRVGHLPFRYYLHQTRQVHLVVVIVCLVILPASRLRLHSSVSFQLCILNIDMVWWCVLLSHLLGSNYVLTEQSIITVPLLFSSANFLRVARSHRPR